MQLFFGNLLSPAILFFVLGLLVGWVKPALKIGPNIGRFLAMYLMIAIGFKGGVAMMEPQGLHGPLVLMMLAGIGLGFLQPLIAYLCLKRTTHLDPMTAAATAAHYGSVSIVTFITTLSFLNAQMIGYEGSIVAVMAVMEVPAILSGLWIAHYATSDTRAVGSVPMRVFIVKTLLSTPILLLLGSFLIGCLSGPTGLERMQGFLVTPFQGILALFLLDIGLLVAHETAHLKELSLSVILFGIYMPLVGMVGGLSLSWCMGLDVGTGLLFTVLASSASYIAVPAAMRLALPTAKASVYMPLTLGVTFPFNILVGIPVYFWLAERLLG